MAGEDYDAAKGVKAEIDRVRASAGAPATGQSSLSPGLRRCADARAYKYRCEVGYVKQEELPGGMLPHIWGIGCCWLVKSFGILGNTDVNDV